MPVSPTSRGETRVATGHGITSEPMDEPKSYERSSRNRTHAQIDDHAQQSGVLTRTERIVANQGELSASTAVESGDGHSHAVPDCAIDVNAESQEFGPLRVRSGPFARWEGFEPPAF
jgi:hypothetical protein